MAQRKRKKRMSKGQRFSERMRKKLVLLFLVIVLAFIALIGKVVVIGLNNRDKYAKIVLDQQQYGSRTIPFKRGDILDTNGTVIATSERVYNVIFDVHNLFERKEELIPEAIRQIKEVVSACFEIDEADIDEAVEKKKGSYYCVLKKQVTYKQAQKFNEYLQNDKQFPYISCIWLEEDFVRRYPYDTLASDLIGFIVSGNVGNAGIEASYNSVLNGTDGREYGYLEDSAVERTVKNADNGHTVVSTIDITLQSIVEKHILAFNEEHRNEARAGEGSKNTAVMIMNPNTGAIMAEASYPNFDLNNPRDLSKYYSESTLEAMSSEDKLTEMNKLWNNFCVSDTFEPGSTMKPFTMAAALENGTLSGNEVYQCNGFKVVAGTTIRCNNRSGHGPQTLSDGIANSCNVVLMDVAFALGANEFRRYETVFGFGQKTGVDLPGELDTSWALFSADKLGPTELATSSFGQGFNVTMTQLISGFASIINGGNYYEPYVIKQILDEHGNVIENKNPVLKKKTISEATSAQMKSYMAQTMTEGTGRNAQVEGYSMGGKTGTAEKIPRGNGKYLLSFMGYAPADNPEVLVYVIIDEPNAEQQAVSKYVTDLARNIMEEAFPYLNITKQEVTE